MTDITIDVEAEYKMKQNGRRWNKEREDETEWDNKTE